MGGKGMAGWVGSSAHLYSRNQKLILCETRYMLFCLVAFSHAGACVLFTGQ